jgi:hypothetical protein
MSSTESFVGFPLTSAATYSDVQSLGVETAKQNNYSKLLQILHHKSAAPKVAQGASGWSVL